MLTLQFVVAQDSEQKKLEPDSEQYARYFTAFAIFGIAVVVFFLLLAIKKNRKTGHQQTAVIRSPILSIEDQSAGPRKPFRTESTDQLVK